MVTTSRSCARSTSRSYIAKALREEIARDARHRCGYCLTSARIIGAPLEIDHIIPGRGRALLRPTAVGLGRAFRLEHEGDLIIGKTATGRATVAAIRLNRAELVEARRAGHR